MWIYLSCGAFFPAMRPPGTIAKGDPQTLQIRARRKEHLDRLRTYYMPGDLGPTYEIADSDYEYRANTRPEAWAAALVKIAMGIDYVSFKDTTVTDWGDEELHKAYLKIWNTTNRALAPPPHTTELPHTYQPRTRDSRWMLNPPYRGVAALASESPEWWDGPTDEEIAALAAEEADLDAQARVQAAHDYAKRIDHSECAHAPTPAARKRCRNRRRHNA